MKDNMINLNREYLVVNKFEFGKHEISAKIGKSFYYIGIDKSACGTYVELFKKIAKNRNYQSKYDAESELHGVFVNNNAVLGRTFFEKISEIEKAANLLSNYTYVQIV